MSLDTAMSRYGNTVAPPAVFVVLGPILAAIHGVRGDPAEMFLDLDGTMLTIGAAATLIHAPSFAKTETLRTPQRIPVTSTTDQRVFSHSLLIPEVTTMIRRMLCDAR